MLGIIPSIARQRENHGEGGDMPDRRDVLGLGILGRTMLFAPSRTAVAADDCSAVTRAEAIGAALLDKYVAAGPRPWPSHIKFQLIRSRREVRTVPGA
jgi:hypothetical protein